MKATLTSDQARCLQAVARYGSAHGFSTATVDSLHRRGLIEATAVSKPHPTKPNAYWRLSEAGATVYAELAAGECPLCARLGVSHTIDRETGHRILRRHLTPTGVWCFDGKRFDAGHPVTP